MELSQQIDAAPQAGDTRLQLLLDTLPHIAFLIGPDGIAEYYNQRLVDYLGYRPGNDAAARTAVHAPDDQAIVDAARLAGRLSAKEYIIEVRWRRHDGAYRWHRIHNKPLFQDGICVGWIGTAVDIHDVRLANDILEQRVAARTAELELTNRALKAEIEQRRLSEKQQDASEHRFRKLYNRTPMALQSVDANACLMDVNDTWTELFGYKRDDVIGRSPTEFMTPESAEVYRKRSWPEMLASAGTVRTVDYQFRTSSGVVFDGRLSARGEFGADGKFIRSWSAIADVTAEKRADRELRHAQRMEAVGQLTAGIAHDFNNLLTAILGNLEMLAKRPIRDDKRTDRLLTSARSAAERGARLTAQLLAFSRQQRIVAEPVDLNQVIGDMLPLLRGTIGAAIGIELIAGTGLWPAMADTSQLELAVLNLAINARDAMPQGGTIAIATANVTRGAPTMPEEPAPGDYIALSVTDTGIGMVDQVRERVFEPFFTTKDIGKGSGLGLPQVLGVVKQLDGGVAVRSVPGEGTAVTMFLPRAVAARMDASDGASGSNAAGTLAAERIVLVDDDADVRMVAADMLRDAGYEVIEADSGAAALNVLADHEHATAAMVVDVAMPAMNGVELASIVRRTRPSLPVIFMTGYAAAGLLPPDARLDVLKKPFQSAELEAKVARALGRAPV